jgi:hypothetical protein
LEKFLRDIVIEDLAEGDVIEFYDAGFRFAIITKIQKIKKRKSKKIVYMIHTDRYNKVPFDKIKEVYIYEDKRTVPKPIMSDIFI